MSSPLRIFAWAEVVVLAVVGVARMFSDEIVIRPHFFIVPAILLLLLASDIHKELLKHHRELLEHTYRDEEEKHHDVCASCDRIISIQFRPVDGNGR